MGQRGLCGTMLSTCRAPAVQVIPGLFIFLCHPRASSRGSIFQSTILTMENNGATRSLWHNAINLPRACRAGGFSGQARE